jgi:hypothetical protein
MPAMEPAIAAPPDPGADGDRPLPFHHVLFSLIRPPAEPFYALFPEAVERLRSRIERDGMLHPIDVFAIDDLRYRFAVGHGVARYLACARLGRSHIMVQVLPGGEAEGLGRRYSSDGRATPINIWRKSLDIRRHRDLIAESSTTKVPQADVARSASIDEGTLSLAIRIVEAVERAAMDVSDSRLYYVSRDEFRRILKADPAQVLSLVDAAFKRRARGRPNANAAAMRFKDLVNAEKDADGVIRMRIDVPGAPDGEGKT